MATERELRPGAFTITERMLSDVPRRKAVRVLLVTYKSIR